MDDYFRYEARIAQDHLVPWLGAWQALPRAGRVLDVGCGYGGTLQAIKETSPEVTATGLDLDPVMVATGQTRLEGTARILNANFFEWSDGLFDLILMRDVLEHIRRPAQALRRAASMLTPGGWLFASFAPFYGPFGGHQHNASGVLSSVPWIQFLPPDFLRARLRIEGNAYKTKDQLHADMDSVFETRLTVRGFLRAAADADLTVVARKSYLVRPDYRIKFGLPAVPAPAFCAELFATGVEALLRKAA